MTDPISRRLANTGSRFNAGTKSMGAPTPIGCTGRRSSARWWTLPSPAPYHSFSTPPKIDDKMLAHGDVSH